MQDVVAFNSFAYSVDSWCEYKKLIPIYPPNRKSHALLRSAGLWVKAAGFNHDCRANAHASFISEDIVIRATRSVNEGDEVTLSYCNPGLSWSARQKKFESTWKFSCHCHRCVSEQGTPSDSSSPSLRTWFRPQSRPSGCQTVSGLDSAAIRILTDSVERDLKAKTRGYLSLANEAQLLFCLMQLAAMQRDATRVQQLACKLLGRHGQRVQISDQASQVINVQPIISGICLEVVSHLLHACSQRNNGIDVSSVQEHAKFLCKIFFGSAHVFSDLHMIVGRCYWQVY